MSNKNGVVLYQQHFYLSTLRRSEKLFIPGEVLQEVHPLFIRLRRVKLREFSQCQNFIVESSLNCIEIVWFTARLWCWVPLCSFHVRVHEQLINHCFRLVWVLGDQVQVFHWLGRDVCRLRWCGNAEVCQCGIGFE